MSVVIPAFNEVANLEAAVAETLEKLGARFRELEVVIVDDGSTDGTDREAVRLARLHRQVRFVRHPRNCGYGAALRTGLVHARGHLLTFVMADGQFNAECVLRLLPFIDGADAVLGLRVERRDSGARLISSELYRWLACGLFGLRTRDINCGKLYRTDALRRMKLTCNGPVIDTEILLWARRLGLRITEVAVPHFPRRSGRSKATNTHNLLTVVVELARLRFSGGIP